MKEPKLKVNEESLRWTPLVLPQSNQMEIMDAPAVSSSIQSGPVGAFNDNAASDKTPSQESPAKPKKRKKRWNKTGYNGRPKKKRKKTANKDLDETSQDHEDSQDEDSATTSVRERDTESQIDEETTEEEPMLDDDDDENEDKCHESPSKEKKDKVTQQDDNVITNGDESSKGANNNCLDENVKSNDHHDTNDLHTKCNDSPSKKKNNAINHSPSHDSSVECSNEDKDNNIISKSKSPQKSISEVKSDNLFSRDETANQNGDIDTTLKSVGQLVPIASEVLYS